MPAAARVGDQVLQDAPHCHAPIHPLNPSPHPALPLAIVSGVPNVLINSQAAATVGSMTMPCVLPGCVPNGPGTVAKGSTTVFIGGMAAARVNDLTSHLGCVSPIPSPTGKIQPPGSPSVIIGG